MNKDEQIQKISRLEAELKDTVSEHQANLAMMQCRFAARE
jgi:hypothetical protein